MASMMNQRVIGVVENMSYLEVTCPHCGQQHREEIFGSGGGADVARTLGTRLGYAVPLLAQVPLDPELRACGDDGRPAGQHGAGTTRCPGTHRIGRHAGPPRPRPVGRQLGLALPAP